MVASIGGGTPLGGVATDAIDEILWNVYRGKLVDALNSRDDLMRDLEKTDDGSGRAHLTLQRSSGTHSMRYQQETTAVPLSGGQQYYNTTITPVEWWGSIGVTVRAQVLSSKSAGAWVPALKAEMNGFALDHRKFMEWGVVGNGNGTIGTSVTDPAGAAIITLNSYAELRKFTVGMNVQFFDDDDDTGVLLTPDATPGSADTECEVIAITAGATPTITLDTNVWDGVGSESTLDVVLAAGNQADIVPVGARGFALSDGDLGNVANYMEGLDGIVNDSDPPMHVTGAGSPIGLQQVPAANEITWRALVNDNGGVNRPMTEFVLGQACDAVEMASGKQITRLVTSYGSRLQYAIDQLNTHRQVNTMTIRGGYQEDTKTDDLVQYGKLKMYPSRFMDPNTVFGVHWADVGLRYWKRPDWWMPDGRITHRAYDSTTQLHAEQCGFWQLVCKQRNSHVRIEDVEGEEVAVY